jgi:L-lactate dehydrogenase complex protein LldG
MRETLRTAVRQGHLPDAAADHPGRFTPPPFEGDPEQRFRAEFTALGGTLHDATGLSSIVEVIKKVLQGETGRSILAWESRWLPVPGVLDALTNEGITILHQPPEHARSQPHRVELAAAALGLTGAHAAIAETGSVVVVSGPGRGRLASLLPRVHVALVRRHDIVATLPTLLASRPDLVTSGANFVCITGPSRTADIEHVLARGVHGPGDVHVVLVD